MSRKRSPVSLGNAANSYRARFLFAVIALAFTSAPALAQAQASGGVSDAGTALPAGGWYGGLSAGRSHVGIHDSMMSVTGTTLSSWSRDQANTGIKLYGGYQINRNLTLEGGYAESGQFDTRREFTTPAFGLQSSEFRTSRFYMGAVGVVPLPNRFSLFGKLGTGYATGAALDATSAAGLPMLTPADLALRRSEWNSKYGLGASYEMSNKLGLRFEYERTNSAGDGRSVEGNVGMWSLGLTKRY